MALRDEKYDQLSDSVFGAALDAASGGQKPVYAGTFEDQLNGIMDRIQNREKFSYDLNADPLYDMYKDRYIQQGKLAMKDTMGQAAALTGGYGNTYGQQVGQQAYDAYLQNLSAVIPELYGMAYGQYQDEGDDLAKQAALLGDQRDNEYNRYRDAVRDWEYDQNLARQREGVEYNRRVDQEKTEYSRQQQAYANLYALIRATGYFPTDEELAAAGMTRGAAEALRSVYNQEAEAMGYGGSGGSGGSGSSGGRSSGGSGGRSSGGGGSGGGSGYWEAEGGDADYYGEVRQLASDLARQAGAERAMTSNAGTLPIIQAVMEDDTLTQAQKSAIQRQVVTNANANVYRGVVGNPTMTAAQNMGGSVPTSSGAARALTDYSASKSSVKSSGSSSSSGKSTSSYTSSGSSGKTSSAAATTIANAFNNAVNKMKSKLK